MSEDIDLARRAHALLLRAMEHEAPARRDFVRTQCAGDPPLLARVLDLLDAADRAGHFLDRPALEPPEPDIPDAVGDYLIVGVLGSGGMATVYEAIQDHPRRRVALKVLHQSMTRRDAYQRFRFETEALARLQHPGIAQIYEAGAAHMGRPAPAPFFAMELVPGARTITDYARALGLSLRRRLAMLADVCDAVHHGHQRGIIHRDLKPANLLVDQSGHAKVIDFGVARTTDPRPDSPTASIGEPQLVGTLAYMSPEQCAPGAPVDVRTDIYSLGVVLYELAVGSLPLDLGDKSLPAAIHAIIHDPPRRPNLGPRSRDDPDPRALEAIILKAIDKDPDRRYDSASALGADLRRALAHQPVDARSPGAIEHLRLFARRHRALVAAGAAVVACIAMLAAVSTTFAIRLGQEVRQRREAQREANAERDTARWHAYTANIAAALSAMRAGEFAQVRARLDAAHVSRGWEWGLISRMADRSLRTVSAHDDMVLDMAVSPDGSRLATAAADGSVRLWDAATGELLASTPSAPAPRAHAVAFTPDARHVLFGDADGVVRLADATAPGDSRQVATLPGQIRTIAAMPDARIVVADASGQALILDLARGLSTPIPSDQPGGIQGATPAPDGSLLATFNDRGLIELRDPADLSVVRALRFPAAIAQVRFSPDSRSLAAVGSSGRLIIWTVADGTIRHEIQATGGINTVRSVAFSADGSMIAAGLIHRGIVVYSLPDARPLGEIGGHAEAVSALAFGDHDRVLTSASWDGTLRTWSLDEVSSQGGTTTLTGHTDHVFSLAFSPDGSLLASSGSDGTVRFWQPDLARTLAVVPAPAEAPAPIVAIALSPDGQTLAAAGRADAVTLIDVPTARPDRTLPAPPRGATSIAFSPDALRLGVGGEQGHVYLWALGSAEAPLVLTGHTARVNSIRFSPDGALIATGSRDHTVRLWDARTGAHLHTFPDHTSDVFAVLFSPDSRRLYTGSRDQTVRVWDVATRAHLRTLAGHGQYITSLALSPDNTRLAAGSWFGQIVLFDVDTLELIALFHAHESAIRAVAFSPDGRFLASASYDHTVRLFDAAARPDAQAARSRAADALDHASARVAPHAAGSADRRALRDRLLAAGLDPVADPWIRNALLLQPLPP